MASRADDTTGRAASREPEPDSEHWAAGPENRACGLREAATDPRQEPTGRPSLRNIRVLI